MQLIKEGGGAYGEPACVCMLGVGLGAHDRGKLDVKVTFLSVDVLCKLTAVNATTLQVTSYLSLFTEERAG